MRWVSREATSTILAEHLERCRIRAAVYGCELAPDGYVFSLDPDGRSPRLPDSISRRMARLAHRLGMSGRHLHEFRHYSATQLLAGGVDLPREYLLGTGDRVLVEASPVDRIWGIGLTAQDERAQHPSAWRGLNLLGFALMDARDAIATERH